MQAVTTLQLWLLLTLSSLTHQKKFCFLPFSDFQKHWAFLITFVLKAMLILSTNINFAHIFLKIYKILRQIWYKWYAHKSVPSSLIQHIKTLKSLLVLEFFFSMLEKEGPGLESHAGPLWETFTCAPSVRMGSFWARRFPCPKTCMLGKLET